MSEIEQGSKVKCVAGSIDQNLKKDTIGYVRGFARFSSYHPREAYVAFEDGSAYWFWMSDLEMVGD